ncbi:MAG: YeeE/YedE thiosulfate transporter family protein [Kiloniellales bacterium]|nr:YeeE/YedE thiosulfate transporter family protein [Kiloniellales bacterium]
MVIESLLLLLSLGFAAVLGFAAHRASICTVKAVEEVLTTRRAFMLLSFAKTVLWVMAVTALLVWALPESRAKLTGWQVSLGGLAGGLVFGMGAVLNKGCAFSTLTRLGGGQLSMLVSLAGFALGVLALGLLEPPAPASTALTSDALRVESGLGARVVVAALGLWGLWETWRLWRSRPAGESFRALALAERYRLSTAALLLGLSNGLLYALHGTWAYTSTLTRGVQQATGDGTGPAPIAWLLFVFLVVGVVASAWQRQSFRLRWRPRPGWLSYLAGGALMGFGAALVPGGNDVLILHAIPTLSPHALPAYLAMLLGIFVSLVVMRRMGASLETIDCSGDICRA